MNTSLWDLFKKPFRKTEPYSFETPPCYWQTDVHSHLLPGLDDGVTSVEQSLACIQELVRWGVKKIITTPHVNQYFPLVDTDRILAGQKAVQEQLDWHQIPVQLDVAAEYMIDDLFLDRLESGPLLTFGPDRYLLFETGFLASSPFLENIIFRMQTQGYRPVLAHPERYRYFYGDDTALVRLKEIGCLFQLNWMSVVGRYGSSARAQANVLLKNKWVDFIGSDLHHPKDIPSLQALFSSPALAMLNEQPLLNDTL